MSHRAGTTRNQTSQTSIERAAQAAVRSLRPGEIGRAIEAGRRGDLAKAARILNRAKGLTGAPVRTRCLPEASR